MQNLNYDPHSDAILQALIAEAAADPDVIGLVLTGSRAIGGVTHESDYDLMFVVTDEAMQRYEASNITPARGATIEPARSTNDIWHESPRNLRLDTVIDWMLPAYAESLVLYDRTGEAKGLIDALRLLPQDQLQEIIAACYDAYLNGLYRSLKCWRRGNEIGARLEAAHTADYLVHLLFALEGRHCPYSSRLIFHLNKLDRQGWQSGELALILLDMISTGQPQRLQGVAQRVRAMLHERGFRNVYDSWEGKIDECLGWAYTNEA